METVTPHYSFKYRFLALQEAIDFNGVRSRLSKYPNWLLDENPKLPYKRRLEEILTMPAKKSSKKSSNFAPLTFINFKFDRETKTAFATWYASKEHLYISALEETIKAENKLSVSWDDEKECYTAAMTGKEDSLNYGKCLTLKSDDWAKALAACAYVHTVVFAGEIWEVDDSTDMV